MRRILSKLRQWRIAGQKTCHKHRRLCIERLAAREVLAASIEITGLPTYGVDGFLSGKVQGVAPAEIGNYRVTAYIQIEGVGWWIKPTAGNPVVPINSDGTFAIDVATGGIDNRATIFVAALLPVGVLPPIALGTSRVPADLQAVAVTSREQYSRTIEFSGMTWGVKESPLGVGPGNNSFSNQPTDVYVDAAGLHLGVTFHDGRWWSTEVILLSHLGYGSYAFTTTSHLESIDKNITFGAFTWDAYGDDDSIPAWPFREIDIEASRWGNAADPTNSQFVVQPFSVAGNLHRYTIPTPTTDPTLTHYFRWTPDHIEFATLQGLRNADSFPSTSVIDRWLYESKVSQNHLIPRSSREKFRFNVWLNNGGAPADGRPAEVVISNFAFSPSSAPIVTGPRTVITPHSSLLAFDSTRTIAINDRDAGISSLTVALNATAGTLQLNTNNVTVFQGAVGTGSLKIRGTIENLNAALATLKYSAPNSLSSARLSVRASDGTLVSNLLTTTITLTNVIPTLSLIPSPAPILEDSGTMQVSLVGISAGGGESQALQLTAVSSNLALAGNPTVTYVSPATTGLLSYSPVANASGTVNFVVTLRDDGGTLNGGLNSVRRAFTQIVLPVNDAPAFLRGPDKVVDNTVGLVSFPGWATQISAGPTDEAAQLLSFHLTADNRSLFQTQPTVDAAGQLSFVPAPSAVGRAALTIVLRDNGGTNHGGKNTSLPQQFTIDVRNPLQLTSPSIPNRDTIASTADASNAIHRGDFNRSMADSSTTTNGQYPSDAASRQEFRAIGSTLTDLYRASLSFDRKSSDSTLDELVDALVDQMLFRRQI